jgi:predicted transcriptional regulator
LDGKRRLITNVSINLNNINNKNKSENMKKNDILNIENRRIIFNHILNNPGMHFRKIQRDLKIPKTTLDYHLNYLKKHGFLEILNQQGYLRYYPSQKHCEIDKKYLNILRQTVPRNIIIYLLLVTHSSQSELIRYAKRWKKHPSKVGHHLNKHHTTISFHIKKLLDMGIIISISDSSYGAQYTLKNPEGIVELLIVYEDSLLKEAKGRILQYLLPEYNNQKVISKLENNFYDMFPHPYHV